MEGPSLVILREELQPFLGQKVLKISGNSKQPLSLLRGRTLGEIRTWGKVLFLKFVSTKRSQADVWTKTHFMMFGSYRIDDPKLNRVPRVEFKFKNGFVYFYSCSFLIGAAEFMAKLDPQVDVLSSHWSPRHVLHLMEGKKDTLLCDLFLDQNLFAGSGNIVKNEVLFNLRLHPLTRLSQIDRADWPKLVRAIHSYCENFYEWKKKFELRRHWQVYRQHRCPLCGEKLIKENNGRLARKSFFCETHQKLPVSPRKIPKLQLHAVLPMKNPTHPEARLDH
jgi:endonuclease VIII